MKTDEGKSAVNHYQLFLPLQPKKKKASSSSTYEYLIVTGSLFHFTRSWQKVCINKHAKL